MFQGPQKRQPRSLSAVLDQTKVLEEFCNTFTLKIVEGIVDLPLSITQLATLLMKIHLNLSNFPLQVIRVFILQFADELQSRTALNELQLLFLTTKSSRRNIILVPNSGGKFAIVDLLDGCLLGYSTLLDRDSHRAV